MNVEQILHQTFGFPAFRGVQRDVVDRVMAGQHTLAVMPTGAGKSLCYQLPALARDGTALVISPLIALMHDQIRAASAVGIKAASLTSADGDREETIKRFRDGELDLLYVAPERATTDGFRRLIDRAHLSLIAIDEAHCVSEWGHDFRPDYRQLTVVLDDHRDIPRLALTATADRRTRADILAQLGIPEDGLIIAGFDRPNIRYMVRPREQTGKQLRDLLADRPGPAIIYAPSRDKAGKFAEQIAASGRPALPYHAGLEPAARKRNQAAFVHSEEMVMAATVAFGMGIDKPDIRLVAHAAIPKSIEAYYQETGRAGRDGEPAEAWMLWSAGDFALARQRIEKEVEPARQAQERERLNALAALVETPTCRRAILLRHFGEDPPEQCGNCDNCIEPPAMLDATEVGRKFLSAAFRTEMRFGVGHLSAVLRGDDNEKVRNFGHHKLSVFGICTPAEMALVPAAARALIARDALRADAYGGLSFGPGARGILTGDETLTIAVPPARKRRVRKGATDYPADPLFEALRAERRRLANEASVPPYVVFHDSTLREIAAARPASLAELARVPGIGAAKLERYGAAMLAVVGAA
ncbi:MAG: DNA helicase RecQ [Sphingomonas sp.]|nr:DNA helicase RecQ [Sphingomonas sp.]